jgi:EAL domain-containing protein (putative c-di-GMP-specific phosphodiesterase class I)
MVDDAVVFSHLDQLREGGTTVSLDDFGTGYSSVRRLQGLPVDAVKLDRSLFDGSSNNNNGLTALIVRGMQNFGLQAVAKGVQDKGDLERARASGCDFAQGQFFGPFLEADEVFGPLARTLQAQS